jgi:hypothetical protein
MVILYFSGGQDPFLEEGVAITCRALHEAGDDPRVLVLAWGMSREAGERRAKELITAFRDVGAGAEAAWPEEGEEVLRRRVAGADMVFLADGDGRTMQHHLRFSGMKKLLQGFEGVLYGDAMGGSMMCRLVLLPPDVYSSTYNMILGLNIVDFSIVPRYRREMDPFVVESSAGRTVFGIPEGSALMYGAGIFSHHGVVHMFKQGKRTILTDRKPF